MANVKRALSGEAERSPSMELLGSTPSGSQNCDLLMLSVSEVVAGVIKENGNPDWPVPRYTERSSSTVQTSLASLDWADLLADYTTFPLTAELHDDIDASLYPPWTKLGTSSSAIIGYAPYTMGLLKLLQNGGANLPSSDARHGIACALWLFHEWENIEASLAAYAENTPHAGDWQFGDRMTSLRTRIRSDRFMTGWEARADIIYSADNLRYEIDGLEYIGDKSLFPFTGGAGSSDTSGPWWDIDAPASGTPDLSGNLYGKIRFAVFGTPFDQWQDDTGFHVA